MNTFTINIKEIYIHIYIENVPYREEGAAVDSKGPATATKAANKLLHGWEWNQWISGSEGFANSFKL